MFEPPDLLTPKCIACKEAIGIGAIICSKCKSYQTRWKNYLQYAASVVGLFTVFAALIVYIVSKAPDLKKMFLWSDNVHVISFASHRDATILNNGDGKVFLLYISIQTAQGFTKTFPINKLLNPDEILTHEADSVEKSVFLYRVISQLPLEHWNHKVSTYGIPSTPNICVSYAILHEQDPLHLMYKNYYKEKFQTIEATASIHFLSLLKREAKQQSLPVRGILLQNPDPGCTK